MSDANKNKSKKQKTEQNENIEDIFKGTPYEGKIHGFVEPDDEIEFHCIRCGQCCTGRNFDGEPILLSPLDIYNACKELNITPEKFVKRYTQESIGPNSGMIILSLACKPNGDCKFLSYDENGLAKCKIHKAKPTICAIHPLGIMHEHDPKTNSDVKRYIVAEHCDRSCHGIKTKVQDIIDSVHGTDEEIDLAMDVRCNWLPDDKRMPDIVEHITVFNTLASGMLSEEKRKELDYSDKFYAFTKTLLDRFQKEIGPLNFTKDVVEDGELIEMCITTLQMTQEVNRKFSYLNYDVTKPFLEQCKDNLEELKKYGEHLNNIDDAIWTLVTGNLSKKQQDKITEFFQISCMMYHM